MPSHREAFLDFLEEEWTHLKSIPLYRDLYAGHPAPPRSVVDLEDLPALGKEDLLRRPLEERTSLWRGQTLALVASSGTTATPLVFPWTHADEQVARLVSRQIHERVPLFSDDLVLVLAPMGLGSMWRHMQREAEIGGAAVLMPGLMPLGELAGLLTAYRPTVLLTLPSLAQRLGEIVCQRGPASSLRLVICGGDVLADQRRRRIEVLWGVPCWNFFGMSELFGPLAGECRNRCGLHVSEYVHIAVRAEQGEASHTGLARCTAVWHRAAPLVNYSSGDVVTLLPDPCSCGDPTTRVVFHGKESQCPLYGGHRLFLDQLDDIVLAETGTGSEWVLEHCVEGHIVLRVEQGIGEVNQESLATRFSEYLASEVRVQVSTTLEDIRREPKPHRLRVAAPIRDVAPAPRLRP
jgi:phenylacetate-CoA ligase